MSTVERRINVNCFRKVLKSIKIFIVHRELLLLMRYSRFPWEYIENINQIQEFSVRRYTFEKRICGRFCSVLLSQYLGLVHYVCGVTAQFFKEVTALLKKKRLPGAFDTRWCLVPGSHLLWHFCFPNTTSINVAVSSSVHTNLVMISSAAAFFFSLQCSRRQWL